MAQLPRLGVRFPLVPLILKIYALLALWGALDKSIHHLAYVMLCENVLFCIYLLFFCNLFFFYMLHWPCYIWTCMIWTSCNSSVIPSTAAGEQKDHYTTPKISHTMRRWWGVTDHARLVQLVLLWLLKPPCLTCCRHVTAALLMWKKGYFDSRMSDEVPTQHNSCHTVWQGCMTMVMEINICKWHCICQS